MKLSRKLIPAMVMLLVSAVLMSTASFAWFAMNKNVVATGMNVKAQADSIFLEIKGTEDTEWGVTGTNDVDAELLPVAHEVFSSAADIEAADSWYYHYVTDPTKANVGKSDENKVSLQTSTEGYVVKTTYQVRLNDNMVQEAIDLRVSSITITAGKGIVAIVRCGDMYKEFDASNTSVAKENGLIAAEMDENVLNVDVYIFINGNDENVFTNNAPNLEGSVIFTLTVDAKPQQNG